MWSLVNGSDVSAIGFESELDNQRLYLHSMTVDSGHAKSKPRANFQQ